MKLMYSLICGLLFSFLSISVNASNPDFKSVPKTIEELSALRCWDRYHLNTVLKKIVDDEIKADVRNSKKIKMLKELSTKLEAKIEIAEEECLAMEIRIDDRKKK